MLRVRIHLQSNHPTGWMLFWDETLTGKLAEKTQSSLLHLSAEPTLQGELLSLRIKNGKGGGCETTGCFLHLDWQRSDDDRETADVYFDADKWRKW